MFWVSSVLGDKSVHTIILEQYKGGNHHPPPQSYIVLHVCLHTEKLQD